MEGVLACLRGWHAGLAFAELEALLPNATLQLETSERWVRVTGAEEKERYGALDVAMDCSVSSLMDALRPRPKAPLNVG